VAAYAQKLRGGKYLGNYNYQQIESLAATSRGEDPHGLRSNFLQMVGLTRSLNTQVKAVN
jgi:Ca-activated chloride channel family protein